MRFRLGVVTGFTVGYYLGAKAGRQRYDQMNRALRRASRSDAVQEATAKVRETVDESLQSARQVVESKVDEGRDAVESRLGNGQSGSGPQSSSR
jgi:CHASE3 domain sensor protein